MKASKHKRAREITCMLTQSMLCKLIIGMSAFDHAPTEQRADGSTIDNKEKQG